MVRLQIQLNADRMADLKKMARDEGVSTSALVRRGVGLVLRDRMSKTEDQLKRMKRQIEGFASELPDLGLHHDKYLAEVLDEDLR